MSKFTALRPKVAPESPHFDPSSELARFDDSGLLAATAPNLDSHPASYPVLPEMKVNGWQEIEPNRCGCWSTDSYVSPERKPFTNRIGRPDRSDLSTGSKIRKR